MSHHGTRLSGMSSDLQFFNLQVITSYVGLLGGSVHIKDDSSINFKVHKELQKNECPHILAGKPPRMLAYLLEM